MIGRRLVPRLVARGHRATATASPDTLGVLERLGAAAAVVDGPDAASVRGAVAWARPDANGSEPSRHSFDVYVRTPPGPPTPITCSLSG